MLTALICSRIFDGEEFHQDAAVLVSGSHVVDIVTFNNIPANAKRIVLGEGLLAPGLIDVQVNGGGGVLFNQHPTLESVHAIAQAHRKFGTTGLLPTVITDTTKTLEKAVDAVKAARNAAVPGILGIHIEGPFLDPQRKGAHPIDLLRKPNAADIAFLSSIECGAVMVTLAPNMVSTALISQLATAGIKISLGHSDATYAEATATLRAGASSFTHLFNAMSQLTGREPGMVGAALADRESFIGIIADGHHIHETSLALAFSSTPSSRFMLVTDAMPPAAGGPDTFFLQGREVKRVGGRLQLQDGTLAGSDLTMDRALRYCVNQMKLPLATALQMASRNPARFLGRSDLGVIKPGALASLVHFNDALEVKQTWIDGQ